MWTYQEAPSCSFLFYFSCRTGSSFINSPPLRRLSPIIAALRDLLAEVPEFPDPPAVAAAWNVYIKSGWAWRATSNIKWEILSTHQKRNNISFREVRTTPSKKQESDWYPEAFYSSQIFSLIIQYLGVGEHEPWTSPVELQGSSQCLLFLFFLRPKYTVSPWTILFLKFLVLAFSP